MAGAVCGFGRLRRAASPGDGRQHRRAGTPVGGGCKRGEQNQAIGRSRGGRTTKIHALCDTAGRLYALLLTGGNVHDLHGARALLAAVPTPRCLLGDKAYDSNDVRAFLTSQASDAVIPPKVTRREPPPFDPVAYKMRNVIERAFCRLKDWRGIATRYDKKAQNFLAGVCLASAVTYWLQ